MRRRLAQMAILNNFNRNDDDDEEEDDDNEDEDEDDDDDDDDDDGDDNEDEDEDDDDDDDDDDGGDDGDDDDDDDDGDDDDDDDDDDDVTIQWIVMDFGLPYFQSNPYAHVDLLCLFDHSFDVESSPVNTCKLASAARNSLCSSASRLLCSSNSFHVHLATAGVPLELQLAMSRYSTEINQVLVSLTVTWFIHDIMIYNDI